MVVVVVVGIVVCFSVFQAFNVLVEKGAGDLANFPDSQYIEAGATIIADRKRIMKDAQVLLQVDRVIEWTVLGPADDTHVYGYNDSTELFTWRRVLKAAAAAARSRTLILTLQ